MTEPVAYLVKSLIDLTWSVSEEKPKGAFKDYKPLYTAEQLHPRVKMNSDEFDEFHDLFEKDFDLYSAITEIADTNLCTTLYDRLFTGTSSDKAKQNEFADLWANYNRDNPEETIEIIPDMKWFVRSKEKEQGFYLFLSNIKNVQDRWYHTTRKDNTEFAISFDTKDEAELWTNPLTEAVHLPVEEK